MAIKTPPQVLIDTGTDSTLNKIYASDLQSVPTVSSGAIFITNTQQYVTNIITDGQTNAAGNTTEVQFNSGSGFAADSGLTYDAGTDSLTVTGNVSAGNVRTDNLLYANGVAWEMGSGGSSYGNSNVVTLLGAFGSNNIVTTGNLSVKNIYANSHANLIFGDASATGNPGMSSTSSLYILSNRAGTEKSWQFSSTGVLTTPGDVTVTGNISAGNASVTANLSAGNLGVTGNITSNGTASLAHINVTTTANLGAVGNITITGGTTGQVLSTNGSGVLTWSTPASSSFTGGNISGAVSITDTTESTNYNTGALKVAGGVGINGELHTFGNISAGGTVFAGHLADWGSWVNPVIVGRDAGSTYVQGALVNTNEAGSADWVAYADNSPADGSEAWMDMGFTGSNFSDPLYTITKSNDGYIFSQGRSDFSGGGNLVIATGSLGSPIHRDIIFATGGFLEENEMARMNHETKSFQISSTTAANATSRGSLEVSGGATVDGNLHVGSSVQISTFMKLTPGTAPSGPTEGTVYYDSTAHKLKVYTGSSWETISSAA